MTLRLYSPAASQLAALEIPDCGCAALELRRRRLLGLPLDAFIAPCEHILGRDHTLTLDQWAALLEMSSPGEYLEPPPCRRDSRVQSQQARVAVLTRRHASGESLWHDRDQLPERADCIRREIVVGRNGSVSETGLEIFRADPPRKAA